MPVTDFRQRTAMLFIAVVLGHIILISAQVNTTRGVPVLEAVTFGVFAEVQRAATSAVAAPNHGRTAPLTRMKRAGLAKRVSIAGAFLGRLRRI